MELRGRKLVSKTSKTVSKPAKKRKVRPTISLPLGGHCKATSFCLKNLFLVLQRKSRWLYMDSPNLLDQQLFDAFISSSGFSSKGNFMRKFSKVGRTRVLKNFDISIRRWLDEKYPSHKQFYLTDSIIYEFDRKLQRLTDSAGGKEIQLKRKIPKDCDGKQLELIECGDECKRPNCDNKDVSCGEFDWQKLMYLVYEGPKVGAGIRSLVPMQRLTFLGHVAGEAVTHLEMARRRKIPERWTYLFLVSEDSSQSLVAAIDPFFYGNHTRFFNHSCDPNCMFELWLVKGKWVVKFFTSRRVKAGEQLTIDYEWRLKKIDCFCGSSKCRGFI